MSIHFSGRDHVLGYLLMMASAVWAVLLLVPYISDEQEGAVRAALALSGQGSYFPEGTLEALHVAIPASALAVYALAYLRPAVGRFVFALHVLASLAITSISGVQVYFGLYAVAGYALPLLEGAALLRLFSASNTSTDR